MTFLKPPGLSINTALIKDSHRKSSGKIRQFVGIQNLEKEFSKNLQSTNYEVNKYDEKKPNDSDYTKLLCEANLYRRKKDYHRAIDIFRKLLQIKPGTLSIYIYLAKALESNQQLSEASKVYREAIFTNPDNIRAYDIYIEFCIENKQFEEARGLIDQALSIDETLQLKILKSKVLFELKEYENVIKLSHDLILEHPGKLISLQLIFIESIIHYYNLHEEKIIDLKLKSFIQNLELTLNDIVHQFPTNIKAKQLLATIRISLGRLREALEILENALDLCPENEELVNSLADLMDLIDWTENPQTQSYHK